MVLLQFSNLLCTLMKRAQGGDPAVVRLTEELNKKYKCEFPGCDAFIVACEEGQFNDIEHYVRLTLPMVMNCGTIVKKVRRRLWIKSMSWQFSLKEKLKVPGRH